MFIPIITALMFISVLSPKKDTFAGIPEKMHIIGLNGGISLNNVQDQNISSLIYKGTGPVFGLSYAFKNKKNRIFLDAKFSTAELYSKYHDPYEGVFPYIDFNKVECRIGYNRDIFNIFNGSLTMIVGSNLSDHYFTYNYAFDYADTYVLIEYRYMNTISLALFTGINFSLKRHKVDCLLDFPLISCVMGYKEFSEYKLEKRFYFFDKLLYINASLIYSFMLSRRLKICTGYSSAYTKHEKFRNIKVTSDGAFLSLSVNLFKNEKKTK